MADRDVVVSVDELRRRRALREARRKFLQALVLGDPDVDERHPCLGDPGRDDPPRQPAS
jgi:hypothetical protein